MMTVRVLLLSSVLSAALLLTGHPAAGQFGPGRQFGWGGFGQQEVKIVEQFDKDGDKRLNTAERKAARTYLEGQGAGRSRFAFRGASGVAPGKRMSQADVKPPYPTTPLYDTGTLRTIFLQFEGSDWEQELATFYGTDVEVPATVVVDGKTYPDVGVHFRGNSSYRMVPEGYKRSLNVSFNYMHKKQDLQGYTTLNLLNSHEDPTYLRSVLSQEIARDYLPAFKANFMRVVINSESWGIYVSDEQFNARFVQDWFGAGGGARWKVPGSPRGRAGLEYWGDDINQYKRMFEIKSGDTPKAWADLVRLCKVLNETPAEKLEEALAPLLDIDGALKFLAVDLALNNGDGYWTRASDYVIYQDPKGRFHILPGDMNETFNSGGGFGFGGVRASFDLDPLIGLTDTGKPLRSKLLAVPALRTRYLGYVRSIAEKWLDWKKLGPLADRYQQLIAADVKADPRKLDSFEEFPADLPGGSEDFRSFVERRRTFLLNYQPNRPSNVAAAR